MGQLTDYQRYKIIFMDEQGYNQVYIAKALNINKNTVSTWLKRYSDTNKLERKEGSGRKPKYDNNKTDSIIEDQFKNRNTTTIRDLKMILENNGQIYSVGAVYNKVINLGFVNRKPIKKPLLTNEHKQARINWALKYQNHDWDTVMFTDECGIHIVEYDIKRWIKDGVNDVIRTVKYPYKISVWGCIKKGGDRCIYIFREIMDSNKYVDILENNMMGMYWDFRNMGSDVIFQHDNDPKHTSKITTKYLEDNNVMVLDWPSNSPDLNPIENMWSILKSNVKKREYKTIKEFTECVVSDWYNIDNSIIDALINSMPKRIKQVIDNKGDYTSY